MWQFVNVTCPSYHERSPELRNQLSGSTNSELLPAPLSPECGCSSARADGGGSQIPFLCCNFLPIPALPTTHDGTKSMGQRYSSFTLQEPKCPGKPFSPMFCSPSRSTLRCSCLGLTVVGQQGLNSFLAGWEDTV